MAKRRSRRREPALDRMVMPQRDNFYIPTFRAEAPIIRSLEDRREYDPVAYQPRGLFHRSARIVVSPKVSRLERPKSAGLPAHIGFNVPREVALCVRRKERREVLFAKRKTGKGAKARRRRNEFSNVRC